MIKVPKFPGVYYRMSDRKVSSDFSKKDFRGTYNADDLCAAIKSSGLSYLPPDQEDPIAWLNLCLAIPGLYDAALALKLFKPDAATRKLARETATTRKKTLEGLTAEGQEGVKHLNRKILQDMFPDKMPKGVEPAHTKDDRCYYVTFKKGNGKVYEKVGWASEGYSAQVAAGIRAERIRSLRHGNELPNKKNKNVTFGEAWEAYDKWLDTGKKHPADDRNRYKNHLKKKFSQMPLSHLSSRDVETLKEDLLKSGLAPATAKHVLALTRQIINRAIKWHLWEGKNPVTEVELPRLNNRRVRFLAAEEAKRLLDALQKVSSQLHDIALVSLHTGMRAGEIFNLTMGDLDFAHDTIFVSDPKSGESRHVFMTSLVRDTLLALKSDDPSELVFKSRKGGPVKEVSAAFDRVVKNLGFNDGVKDPRQKIVFHSIRHSFASWLVSRGTPIYTVQALLGHKSLVMAQRYAHLAPNTEKEALKNIEMTLKEAKSEKDDEPAP